MVVKPVATGKTIIVQNVSKKSKSKKKSSKPRNGNFAMGAGQRVFRQTAGMPAAMGTRYLKPTVEFAGCVHQGRKGLRMIATVPSFNVAVASGSTASGDSCLRDASYTSGAYTKTWSIDPNVSNRYVNPAVPLLSGCFDRMIIRSVSFHYRQAGGTTSTYEPAIFGMALDFNHPAFSTVTPTKLLGLQDSFEFSLWEDWDYHVANPDPRLLYSYDVGTSSSDVRLQDAGIFSMLQLFSSAGAVDYGILHMTWDIEYYDFSPIYKSVSLTATHAEPVVRHARGSLPLPLMITADESDETKSKDEDRRSDASFCIPPRPLNRPSAVRR